MINSHESFNKSNILVNSVGHSVISVGPSWSLRDLSWSLRDLSWSFRDLSWFLRERAQWALNELSQWSLQESIMVVVVLVSRQKLMLGGHSAVSRWSPWNLLKIELLVSQWSLKDHQSVSTDCFGGLETAETSGQVLSLNGLRSVERGNN